MNKKLLICLIIILSLFFFLVEVAIVLLNDARGSFLKFGVYILVPLVALIFGLFLSILTANIISTIKKRVTFGILLPIFPMLGISLFHTITVRLNELYTQITEESEFGSMASFINISSVEELFNLWAVNILLIFFFNLPFIFYIITKRKEIESPKIFLLYFLIIPIIIFVYFISKFIVSVG